MPATVLPVFARSDGVNNKIDPARLTWDPKSGNASLAAAVNVEIDNTGRIRMRRGKTTLSASAAHSIFAAWNTCLFMRQGSLYRLNPDYSVTGVRSEMQNLPTQYVAVDQKIYHSNGVDTGVYWVSDQTDHAWIGKPYVGPVTKWEISTTPPIGELLTLMDAYMLVGVENLIYFSMPFSYSQYRLSKDLVILEDPLTMMMSVCGGVWVGTEKKTYFLEGTDPQQWKLSEKADYSPIRGTGAYRDFPAGDNLNVQKPSVVWASTQGVCVGDQDGNFQNLTYEKLEYPAASRGAGIVIGNRYVVSMM